MPVDSLFTVSSVAKGLFDIPDIASEINDAQRVMIQVQSGILRVRFVGADPTTSLGNTVSSGGWVEVTSRADIRLFRMIRDGGTTDAVIYVTVWRG